MRYSNQELWQFIKQHPDFANFTGKKHDLRDWTKVNPEISVNLEKGSWYNHKTGEGGGLFDLAKVLNVLPETKKNIPTANEIWQKYQVVTYDSELNQLAKSYFTDHRKIPTENYSDLLKNGLIRINKYKGDQMLIYPSLTPETALLAMGNKPYEVNRIQRIFVNPDGSSHLKGKQHYGSNGNGSAAFVIPPLKQKYSKNHAVVFEGLEDALSVRSEYPDSTILVATDKAGLKHVQGFFNSGRLQECLIIADHDTDENPEATGQALSWQLGQKLEKMGIHVSVKMPAKPKEDANSALQSGKLGEWIESLIDIPEKFRSSEHNAVKNNELVVLSLEELLKRETTLRQNLLSPWLPEQGLCMIYASRGLGKTWVALMISYAVSSGGRFLNWTAEKASGVLYIDGEMPLRVMKERIAQIVMSEEFEIQAPLDFITPDAQELCIPDLSTHSGQELIDKLITEKTKLIVMDNLSTLFRTGKENESEGWLPVQEWALKLRRRGISVLFIHHAGKAGQQRGTSRREDVLDTVIALKKPADHTPVDGAYFEIHFEKARGLYGDEVKPFEARLETHEDNEGIKTINWIQKNLEDSTREKVKRFFNEEWSQKEIAEKLEIKKSTVSYHVKKLRGEGLIT